MKYKIKKARIEDAKGVAKVNIKSWRETYKGIIDDKFLKSLSVKPNTKKWEERIKKAKKDNWLFIAENSLEGVIGFIYGGITREKIGKFKGELYAIYVLKKHQNKKLGFKLIKKLCTVFKKHGIKNMQVGVLKDNPSKYFYIKYGAKLFKTTKIKIGEKKLSEEYYGWVNFGNFLK